MMQLQARHTAKSENIVTALRPWRRRLLAQQGTRWTARGLVVGILVACLVLLIAHFIPWMGAIYWAASLAILSTLLGLGAALWYRPTFATTARRVDKQLKLHDRLSTAWELRDEVSPLATLQRRDALKQLRTHTPKDALSLRPSRSLFIVFGVALLAFILLLVLPNPMDAVLRQQAAFQKSVAKQISQVEQTRQQLLHQQSITPEQKKQLDKILSELEGKLQQAKNSTQAQQALAEAQAKLNQLRNPDAANRLQGHNAASSSLQGSNNRTLNAVGQTLSNNDLKQLANSLKNLSSQIGKLTPSQRSQLAQQLEQAANQASQNPQLSSALHQLAKSVADGSQSEVNDAISAVEEATQQDVNDANQSSAAGQAQKSVQQAANNLATANDGTSEAGQAQAQGQGQNQQNQAQEGQGQGQAQQVQGQGPGDSPTQGQAHGQGQGQGQGNNQGNGSGQGGSGQGGSGGGNGAGNNQGKQEQVTVPGQIGSGASVQNQDPGNNGVVQGGSSVPYNQVVQEYAQAAHDAIDNSSIPADEKDLVHGYFDSLEGQQ